MVNNFKFDWLELGKKHEFFVVVAACYGEFLNSVEFFHFSTFGAKVTADKRPQETI